MRTNFKKLLWWLVLAAVLLFILYPLIKPGLIITDDADWMVIRLSAFYQSFRDGQFPVRFLGRLNFNYGYPVSNFLYPGFLYLGSLIHIIGYSFTDSVKILLAGSVIGSTIFLYLWLRTFFKPVSSRIGILVFLLSPYLLFDLYKRGSAGELLALLAMTISLWALERKIHWLIPLSIAFLIVSHNTLALLYGLVFLGYIIIRRSWTYLIPAVIGIILTAFFWMPALMERSYVAFNSIIVSDPKDYFPISQTLVMYQAGLVIATVWTYWRSRFSYHKEQWFFSFILIVSGMLALIFSAPLWTHPLLLHFVQFPFRFLAIWFIAAPWIASYFLESVRQKKKWIYALILIGPAVIYAVMAIGGSKSVIRDEGYYTTNEATTTVANEYMPRWVVDVPQERAKQKVDFFDGNGVITILKQTTRLIALTVVAAQDSTLAINTVYYPGWGATLDGKPVIIDYQNRKGVMHIVIPKGEHALRVDFRETALRFLADTVSMTGLVTYIVYLATAKFCAVHMSNLKKYFGEFSA